MTGPAVRDAFAVQACIDILGRGIPAYALFALVPRGIAAPHTGAVRLTISLGFGVTFAALVFVSAAIGGACAVGARLSVAVALAARVLDAHGLSIGGLIAIGLPQQWMNHHNESFIVSVPVSLSGAWNEGVCGLLCSVQV